MNTYPDLPSHLVGRKVVMRWTNHHAFIRIHPGGDVDTAERASEWAHLVLHQNPDQSYFLSSAPHPTTLCVVTHTHDIIALRERVNVTFNFWIYSGDKPNEWVVEHADCQLDNCFLGISHAKVVMTHIPHTWTFFAIAEDNPTRGLDADSSVAIRDALQAVHSITNIGNHNILVVLQLGINLGHC
jgi:hypothetical protein